MAEALMMKHRQRGNSCHLCGRRSGQLVDVRYARDAEHARVVEMQGPDTHYVRVCADCGRRIVALATEV